LGWPRDATGQLDAAFESFDRAVEERDQSMMMILSFGRLDPIRRDPGFTESAPKMRLA
jgi:hypothetical protein